MRLAWKMSVLFVVLAVGAPLTAQAEDADSEFCAMLAGASSDGPERVGDVASGAVRTPGVSVLREVTAGLGYLVIVALCLVVGPAGRVQGARSDDAEPRLGGCVARAARRLQFPSTGAGVTAIDVPITFSVP